MSLFKKIFRRQLVVALITLAFVATVILVAVISTHPVLGFDLSISQKIQSRGVRYLPFMQFISFFGNGAVAIALPCIAALVFYILKRRREAAFILGTFIADLITGLLKQAIHRPRPTASAITLYQHLTDPSFPSGHVVHYVVFFGFLAVSVISIRKAPLIVRGIVSIASLILIALASVSRIYLGAHWATDVIGGYLVGFMLLASMLILYFEPRYRDP